jgi:hypothetical protein
LMSSILYVIDRITVWRSFFINYREWYTLGTDCRHDHDYSWNVTDVTESYYRQKPQDEEMAQRRNISKAEMKFVGI